MTRPGGMVEARWGYCDVAGYVLASFSSSLRSAASSVMLGTSSARHSIHRKSRETSSPPTARAVSPLGISWVPGGMMERGNVTLGASGTALSVGVVKVCRPHVWSWPDKSVHDSNVASGFVGPTHTNLPSWTLTFVVVLSSKWIVNLVTPSLAMPTKTVTANWPGSKASCTDCDDPSGPPEPGLPMQMAGFPPTVCKGVNVPSAGSEGGSLCFLRWPCPA